MKMISEDDTEAAIINQLESGQVEGTSNHLAEMLFKCLRCSDILIAVKEWNGFYADGYSGLKNQQESILACLSDIRKSTTDRYYLEHNSNQLHFIRLQGSWSHGYLVPITSTNNTLLGYTVLLSQAELHLSREQLQMLSLFNQVLSCNLHDRMSIASLQQQLKNFESAKRMLAHDIRSPLNGIKGVIQLAADDLANNKMVDLPLYVQMIGESSTSLLTMTEDLLNSSVLPDSHTITGEDHYTLKVFCTQLLRLFKPRLVRKKINYDFSVAPEMSEIPFMKDHTFQITSNLLSNAIKFTQEGGNIRVRLGMQVEHGRKKLSIHITDSGVGMDKNAIESILTGSGAHTMGTTGETGHGFGLVAVRELIDSVKGAMKIDSAIGKGTTFDVVLPLK